jgi:serine/threonine protein kinase
VTTDPDTEKPPAFQIDDTLSRRTISQLTHPHICPVYDVGEQPGTAFLVMEYLEGHSLNDWLERNPLPFDQAFTIAIEIAGALCGVSSRYRPPRCKPGHSDVAEERGQCWPESVVDSVG